jgi:hypothetical protein
MYAQVLALRRRDDDDVGGLLGLEQARPKGPLGFKERGFSFIPLRPAHLEFMACVYGREVPSIDEVVGRAMVDQFFLPAGVVLVHFEPSGINKLHAHFGKWLRIFPKDILRGMSEVCKWLRERNIFVLHAIADEGVEGSDYLLQWLGAKPTGERGDVGPLYRLDLRACKI